LAKRTGETNSVMFTDFVTHAKRQWWFIAAMAVLVVCGVVTVLAVRGEETHARTSHFVLHPDAGMPAAEVPPALDVLDGPIVQTLLRVLNNEELLERAASSAGLDGTDGVALDTTVQPGSAYFDATVRGDTEADVEAAARSLGPVAARYVDDSYEGYDLTLLGSDAQTHRSFPPSPAVVILSLLFGTLLAVALLFVEWCAHRLDFSTGVPRVRLAGTQQAVPDAVPVADEVPEKKPAARKPRTTKPRTSKPRASSSTGSTPTTKPKSSARTTKSTAAPPSTPDERVGAPEPAAPPSTPNEQAAPPEPVVPGTDEGGTTLPEPHANGHPASDRADDAMAAPQLDAAETDTTSDRHAGNEHEATPAP
jgi:hypothetical protein